MNIKRITLAVVAAAVLLFATPTAASAHSADITGVAECQPDGTYTVVWTGDTYNVPANEEAEVKVITPENLWLHEWAEHYANHGLTPLAPNASFTWTQTGIHGDATSAGVTFQIDWHGHSSDPTGTVKLPGDCATPEPEITYVTPQTPEAFVKECYAADEKPFVVLPADGEFTYTVTENPLSVFTVTATPLPETFTDVPAAIALGWSHTESQSVTRVYDLSYVKACVVEEPPVIVDPPVEEPPVEEPVEPEQPANPVVTPETPAEAPSEPTAPLSTVSEPVAPAELAATGPEDDWEARAALLLGGTGMILSGIAMVIRRSRRNNNNEEV